MSNKFNIESLIKLSAFEVTDSEKKEYDKEIDDFLKYAEIINSADCDNMAPSAHPTESAAKMRKDNDKVWEDLEKILANAPVRDKSAYLVPPQKARPGEEKESGEKTAVSSGTDDYEAVIGLEVHAHLKTKSKLFCSCPTEFGNDPNHNTCPVCNGHPGVLPVLNEEAVRMAILSGLAFNCKINKKSVFARKNYFYPDLPKGYQISQFEEPICSGGFVEIDDNGAPVAIKLNRIHMEEDAGKMVHVGAPGIWGSKASAVDFNRTSVPLIEIVSEPDIKSAKHAKDYVIMLRSVLVQLGICDGNLEEGSLRCDANISIRKIGDKQLGTKTEVKNMNSFKAIEKAIEFEIERQIMLKKAGKPIVQETRLWDENSQKTFSMRSKEESHDYRYFPDPDLLPIMLDEDYIESLKEFVPEYPLKKKYNYINIYNLSEEQAMLLINDAAFTKYFDKLLHLYKDHKNAANWFFNELISYTSDFKNIHISPDDFADFLKRIDSGEISGKIGKEVLRKSFDSKRLLSDIIEKDGYKQISNEDEIKKMIEGVIAANPSEVGEYKNGKEKLFGFFVGETMKVTKGKANPAVVNKLLKELLAR